MTRLKILPCLLLLSLLFLSAVFPQTPGVLYWEYPDFIIQEQAKYPRAAAGGGLMAVVWQEIEVIDDETWETYLSMQSSRDGYNWDRNERFAGPFTFAGSEAPISSIAVNSDGTVFVAASIGEDSVTIFQSFDGGKSFAGGPVTVATEGDIAVAPRLFTRSDGGIILYITQKYVGEADLSGATLARTPLSVYYAFSGDGRSWTTFAPLVTEPELVSNYTVLPHHAAINGTDYVVFQSLVTQGRTTSYQLYMKTSTNEGRSWSPAVLLTDFAGMGRDLATDDTEYIRFDNQRAFLAPLEEGLGISWERRRVGDIYTHVFFGFLDENLSSGLRAEQVTTGNLTHQSPECVQYNGDIYTFWFDNREGDNRVFTAARSDRGGIIEWIEPRETNKWLGYTAGVSTFPNPVLVNGMLYVFWENVGSNTTRYAFLAPDRTVPRVVPSAANFRIGERHKQDIYSFTWRVPDDSSGVEGYSYVLDRDPEGLPPLRIKAFMNVLSTQMTVQEDGNWYFHISARDRAGNWSVPETIAFYRDTTPPPPVTIEVPELDEMGYTLSNTNTFTWKPPDDPYIRGYSYNLEYLGSAKREIDPETINLSGPPHKLLVT